MRIQSEIQRERETIRVPAELYVKHPIVTPSGNAGPSAYPLDLYVKHILL